ncbi:hypothetical protein [Aeromonas hydrophila]|uniref:hypothetical protein n=1 Tax=Aeromonas hydrophila TaxID=644 RepID=UPI00235DDF0E|nr:hypothetical protein [Aeromonas hydrophila]
MKVDVYKAKKGYVFVKAEEDPSHHVPAAVGFGKLVKENHDSSINSSNPNVIDDGINAQGYYHSTTLVVNIGSAMNIPGYVPPEE